MRERLGKVTGRARAEHRLRHPSFERRMRIPLRTRYGPCAMTALVAALAVVGVVPGRARRARRLRHGSGRAAVHVSLAYIALVVGPTFLQAVGR